MKYKPIVMIGIATALVGFTYAKSDNEPNHGVGHEVVYICHATGSDTHPYQFIATDNSGEINGHSKHEDDFVTTEDNTDCDKPEDPQPVPEVPEDPQVTPPAPQPAPTPPLHTESAKVLPSVGGHAK